MNNKFPFLTAIQTPEADLNKTKVTIEFITTPQLVEHNKKSYVCINESWTEIVDNDKLETYLPKLLEFVDTMRTLKVIKDEKESLEYLKNKSVIEEVLLKNK